jgi:hypothetical protein
MTQLSAEAQLQDGNAEVFKAYLTWRKKRSRVRKESSIRSYWKRLSMYYKNLTGHNMAQEILEDVCNVRSPLAHAAVSRSWRDLLMLPN